MESATIEFFEHALAQYTGEFGSKKFQILTSEHVYEKIKESAKPVLKSLTPLLKEVSEFQTHYGQEKREIPSVGRLDRGHKEYDPSYDSVPYFPWPNIGKTIAESLTYTEARIEKVSFEVMELGCYINMINHGIPDTWGSVERLNEPPLPDSSHTIMRELRSRWLTKSVDVMSAINQSQSADLWNDPYRLKATSSYPERLQAFKPILDFQLQLYKDLHLIPETKILVMSPGFFDRRRKNLLDIFEILFFAGALLWDETLKVVKYWRP